MLARRDQHNQRLYRDITRITSELERSRDALYSGVFGRTRYFVGLARRALRRLGQR